MAKTVTMPKLGMTMLEGTIVEWRKKEGDRVEKGEILYVVETEKVAYEVEAAVSGILAKIVAKTGDVVPVGGPVAYITEPGETTGAFLSTGVGAEIQPVVSTQPVKPDAALSAAAPATATSAEPRIKISPVARKIAAEHGLDISKIAATGPDGRIVREDVLRAIENASRVESASERTIPPGELRPLSSMRKVIAQKMIESFRTPHFYLTMEVDAWELERTRSLLMPEVENKAGIRLTITDLLIKLAARALEDKPDLNVAYVDGALKLCEHVNIGMVASVPGGLVVPVFKEANKKSLVAIARSRSEMMQKARELKLSLEDMTGSSFTLSNLGMFGIDQFSAILQPPEAAMLAVGRIAKKPVVRNDEVVIRPVMILTLSIDHRVLDGAIGADFLNTLKKYIEEPARFLL